jgi:lipopolysaccharide heptosyltransferase II
MSATTRPTPPLKKRISWGVVYGFFRAIEAVLSVLPLGLVARSGMVVGAIVYWTASGSRRVVFRNLRIAFGDEMDEKQRREMAKKHFRSLVSNLFCGIKLPMMSEEAIARRVRMEGIEHIEEAIANNTPVIHLITHSSSWELLTQTPSLFLFGKKPATVYQTLRNPYLNALVLRRRQKRGYILFDRQEGFHGPVKHLRGGGHIGILVDQHAGDHGIWCPFFNRLASTTPVAALVAKRSGSVMLPLSVLDDGPGRWRMISGPAVNPNRKASIDQLTIAMNEVVADMIRVAPHNWFWVHERWKTPKPEFLLSIYKRGIALPEDKDPKTLQPFELLIRSPNWLGDACMAFPAVRAMRADRPDLRITVFGPEKLRDLWEAMPEVDRYIGKQGKENPWAVAKRIRDTGIHFDAAVLLTNSTRSTLEFWLAGIPRRVGYKVSLRRRMLNQIIPEPKPGGPPEHHAKRYMRIAIRIGAPRDETPFWKTERPEHGDRSGRLKVGLCAGAEYGPAKRWPLDRYAAVANAVSSARPEVDWHLFGAPGEAAMGEELAAQVTGSCENLVGKTTLAELITHLKECDLLLTNDTGTMHLAAALGVPTVSIFGSTEPSLTGPLGNHHRVLRHHVPCSPCFKRECPFGHYDCMTGLSVQTVTEAVLEKLPR